jgi:hypothetical protein
MKNKKFFFLDKDNKIYSAGRRNLGFLSEGALSIKAGNSFKGAQRASSVTFLPFFPLILSNSFSNLLHSTVSRDFNNAIGSKRYWSIKPNFG